MLTIKVCHGHACSSALSPYVLDRVKAECGIGEAQQEGKLPKSGKPVKVEISPCQGKCKQCVNVSLEGQGSPQQITQCDPIKIGNILANK